MNWPFLFKITFLVLKLLKSADGVRSLLETVAKALPQIGNLGVLFLLMFYMFAALGVELFGRIGRHTICKSLFSHMYSFFSKLNVRVYWRPPVWGYGWSQQFQQFRNDFSNTFPHCNGRLERNYERYIAKGLWFSKRLCQELLCLEFCASHLFYHFCFNVSARPYQCCRCSSYGKFRKLERKGKHLLNVLTRYISLVF